MLSLLLAPFPALPLPPLVLLPLLPPPLFPSSPLGLPPLHLLSRPDLALELPLLLLDCSELRPHALPLGPSGGGLGSVFLVRLGAADALLLGCLVANLGAAQLADVRLDGAGVNQRADDLLCLLVHAAAVQRAIDQRCGFSALEGQELCRIPLDFLLGDFENGFGDLGFVVLDLA